MPALQNISPELVKAYQDEISKSSSPATAKRKEVSLNKFFDWAKTEGHLNENPIAPQRAAREVTSDAVIVKPKKVRNVEPKTWVVVGMTACLVVLVFLLTWKVGLPIPFIRTPASEGVPDSLIQTNNQNGSSQASVSLTANGSVNGAWKLYAKLKLTEADGSPKVGTQSIAFKVFNQSTGGDPLFTSGEQTVTTDSNGSTLISLDNVPASLFFENEKLFLEPTASGTPTSSRIPVNSANVSANLGGYLAANPDVGAGPETVPIINSEGSLVFASESPAIKAPAGDLLIEGQTVTIKTADGGDGDLEFNPDGKGIAHFLFEGANGDFLNAQGPNLRTGSLYYGMVPNNATGYKLINLQSGAPTMTTKFSVDALGNTYIGKDLNVKEDIATNGVDRLTSTGALTNITGYNQISGNFVINQGPGDFASITKDITSGGALSDVLTLTLDERGKPETSNSTYSTLVLNRYDGAIEAMALLVDNGNAQFDGQLRLGRFESNPTAVGTGSLIYNSTDNQIYFWNGTSWVAPSGSTSFANLTSGTNTTATMIVGSGASLTFSGTGTIEASEVTCTGCVSNSELANSSISFAGDIGSTSISLGSTLNVVGGEGIDTSVVGTTLTVSGEDASTTNKGIASFDSNFFSVTAGNVTIADDSLDFAQFQDAMDLDASTDINLGANTLSTSGSGALNFASTGQVTFSGNVDATNGLDVTGANLTVGGANFIVDPATGNITTAGNLTVNGNTILGNASTDTLTFNGSVAQDSDLIPLTTTGTNDLGSLAIPWDNLYATNIFQNGNAVCDASGANCPVNYWTQANGVLYPTSNTVDVLIGSDATESAKFAFMNVASGTPTASISGTTTNVATFLTGEGNLATTNMADLTLGGSTTGNVIINSRGSTALTANGPNLSTPGTFTFPNGNTLTGVANYLQLSQGVSVGGGTTFFFDSSGNLNANNGTFAGDVAVNGGDLTSTSGTFNLLNSGVTNINLGGAATSIDIGAASGTTSINNSLTVDGNTTLGDAITDSITFTGRAASDLLPIADNTYDLGSASLQWAEIHGVALFQNGNSVCDSSGTNCPTGATLWEQLNGALYPSNNSVDVLIGSDATESAKFAFMNVSSGTPTASISGTTANVATYLTGEGNLATTNMADLTLGGSTTGNVIINSRGSTALTANGSDLTASGTVTLPNSNVLTGVTNYLQLSQGVSVGGGTTFYFDASGNLNANDGTFAGTLTANGDTILGDAITDNITFNGRIAQDSDIIPITTTGTNDLGSLALPWDNIYGVALFQNGNAVCDSSGANCPAASNFWQLNSDVLSPVNTWYDVVVGGDSTASAKFQAFGVENTDGNIAALNSDTITTGNVFEASASAITSGNIIQLGEGGGQNFTGNGIFMDFDNAGGGSFTGNFLQFNNAGTTRFTVDSTGNMTLAGTTGATFTGTGAGITFSGSGTHNISATNTASNLSLDSGNAAVLQLNNTSAGDVEIAGGSAATGCTIANATGNLTCSGDVAVNGGDITTTQTTGTVYNTGTTTVNLGGQATTVDIGAATGTTSVNNSLAVDGNSTLGNAGTDTITFTGSVNSDILPLTDNTYDLGSAALQWAEIHGVAIFQNGNAVCDSSGANCPEATNYWQLNNEILSPANSTWDLAVGGTGTASAHFQAFGIETESGNIAKLTSDVITTGNVFEATASAITTGNMILLSQGGEQNFTGNGIEMDFDNTGGGSFTGNFLQFSNDSNLMFSVDSLGNIFGDGNLVLGDTSTLQIGGETGTTYNSLANIGEAPVGAAAIAAITSDNDLFVGGDFQVGGTMYDSSGNVIGGYWTQSGDNLYPTNINSLVGIGTTSPFARLTVVNDPDTNGGTFTGKAAFAVDQYENEDILTASASGQTRLTLENDGTLRLFNSSSSITNDSGDITIDAASNNISFAGDNLTNIGNASMSTLTVTGGSVDLSGAATNVAIIDNTANAFTIRQGANTYMDISTTDNTESLTIDLPTGGATSLTGNLFTSNIAKTINLGTGTAADTINIGTSGADVITIGNSNASTTMALTGGDDWSIATNGNFTTGGYVAATGVGQFGAQATAAYSRFGSAATGHSLNSAADVLISEDLELNGGLYLDGKIIYNTQGTAAIILCTGGSGASCENTSALQNTLSTGVWVIDNQVNVGEPALSVNNAKGGDLIVASASGTLAFRVANSGDVFLGNNAGTDLTVGGGTGKIDAGTVDPPYTINGKKFATYMAGMVGVKEEVVGQATTSEYVPGHGYRYVIDFNSLPEGSDLWLFGKTANIKETIGEMVALLTPSFPTRVWYEVDETEKRLVIYSAKPTKISYRLTAPRFDAGEWSNRRDEESETIGFVINDEDNPNGNPVTVALQTISDFTFEKVQKGFFRIKDGAGNIVDGVESIGTLVAGNIKVGALETIDQVTQTLTAKNITAEEASIGLLSPLAGDENVIIRIGSESSESGKLAIQNARGDEVASIDSFGNANFRGDVRARNLDEMEKILDEVKINQKLLNEAGSWGINTASGSANLTDLSVENLFVTGQGAFHSLSVSDSLAIGTDMVIQSIEKDGQRLSSIDTLTAPLRLQALALAPIEMMAGMVKIDTSGNVNISGNLNVAGRIESKGLTLTAEENPEASASALLSLNAEDGTTVASVDASGSAEFASLRTGGLVIAAGEVTPVSTSEGYEIQTNTSIGSAVIPAGASEITVKSPQINANAMVYVTPTSSTSNRVLYVKMKDNGYFKVGFTEALEQDATFNWWVVKTE